MHLQKQWARLNPSRKETHFCWLCVGMALSGIALGKSYLRNSILIARRLPRPLSVDHSQDHEAVVRWRNAYFCQRTHGPAWQTAVSCVGSTTKLIWKGTSLEPEAVKKLLIWRQFQQWCRTHPFCRYVTHKQDVILNLSVTVSPIPDQSQCHIHFLDLSWIILSLSLWLSIFSSGALVLCFVHILKRWGCYLTR